jgi:sulfite oxidase
MLDLVSPKSGFIVHSETPYNAEPPPDRLMASLRTAASDFYVRAHGDIPRIDAGAHRLVVKGKVKRPLDLGMAEIMGNFPRRAVTAVMQCAGNRRADLAKVKPVAGDLWAAGAIGSAEWTGAALADVLRAAGADESAGLHVAFDCLDKCEIDGRKFRYGASIPIAKALSPEVLLAYAMNGENLAPAHGAPLRVVAPGFAGVRSPKWLATITVQEKPSTNYIQAHEYKLYPPDVSQKTADPDKGVTIDDMPLNSAICEPAADAVLEAGTTTIRGWAFAAGRKIARVDVSIDGGRNWLQAEMAHDPLAPWSWTFWEIATELAKGEHELAARAWDSAGQTQPARAEEVWNFKGYLAVCWDRVRVMVV